MSHTIHLALTMFHFVVAIAAVSMTIVVSTYAFSTSCNVDSCPITTYITSTFFSTRRVETNLGWAVATERSKFDISSAKRFQYPVVDGTAYDGYAFSHYFECMHVAQMADNTCKFPDSVGDYVTCLTLNNSATKTALQVCDKFPMVAVPGYTHFPTSDEYIVCLTNQPALWNSLSVRASSNVFRSCIAKTVWPFFEVPLDFDSIVPFGSYNWGLFIVLGMVVMTSFAVYSASWVEEGYVKKGEPQYFMRLGLFWALVAWLWNLSFFVIFILVGFRDSGSFESNGGLPTTITTTLATLSVLAVVLVYFGNEIFTPTFWEFAVNPLDGVTGFGKVVKHVKYWDPDGSSHSLLSANGNLGSNMPNPSTPVYEISPEAVARYYTPPLLSTWADGYIADAFLFLGMAGATQQLTTDQAWSIFVLISLYRVLNMMMGRFMYECFMNNLSLPDNANIDKFNIRPAMFGSETNKTTESDPDDPHLSTRVMALSTQIAAIYLFIAILFLVFNGNVVLSDVKIFRDFFVCCFIVPETIRMLLHIYCQIYHTTHKASPWMLLNVSFFIWTWDLLTRLVFVSLVFLQTDDTMQGTRRYLATQTTALLSTYLGIFA